MLWLHSRIGNGAFFISIRSRVLMKWTSSNKAWVKTVAREGRTTAHTAPTMASKILGMGNPLLDISAEVDLKLCKKYELDVNNQILAGPKHLPLYDELKSMSSVNYIPGGATQNSIRVAQWLLPENSTTFMGCVGQDEFANIMQNNCERDGVSVRYQIDPDTPTGTCAVLITSRTNRSLVANLGAANNYNISHVQQPDNWEIVEAASIFYMAGFFLTVSPETVMLVARHAAENNKTFAMNLSAPFLCKFFKEAMLDAAPYWDYLFGNETEAQAFADSIDWKTSDLKEIALRIASISKANKQRERVVVITQGDKPTLVAVNGTVTEYSVKRVPLNNIVDTNSAGDAFVGGFLAQLALGKGLEESVRCAQYSAREIIQQLCCTLPPKAKFNSTQ